MPDRIQLRRQRGWRLPAGAINVARPGKFGNPFRIGDRYSPHNDHPDVSIASSGPVITITRELAVAMFRAYLDAHDVRLLRNELAGHDLACWCPLDELCHADVLLEMANP